MKKFNKIFVCGISRTGTKSLGDYFKLLDLKVQHNGGQVLKPSLFSEIDVLLDDKQTQFLYEVLNQKFPNSLFVYTNRNDESWKKWALISLVLTFTSGLQAIAFWAIRLDFNLTWWLFNGFLLIYPLFYIPKFLKK